VLSDLCKVLCVKFKARVVLKNVSVGTNLILFKVENFEENENFKALNNV